MNAWITGGPDKRVIWEWKRLIDLSKLSDGLLLQQNVNQS